MSSSQSLRRRDFVRDCVRSLPSLPLAARAIAAGTLASTTACCAGLRYAVGQDLNDRVVVPRAAFAGGDYLLVENTHTDRPIYVHRKEPEIHTAVLAECTHRQCQPEPSGDRLVCPCHGSEFGHDGALLVGPAERPLPTFRVETTPDEVHIFWDGGAP